MAAILLALSGCKSLPFGKDKKEDESPAQVGEAQMKVPVGTVHLVSPSGGFALIRSTKFMQIEPGTPLTTVGIGGVETARLEVSPARKGSFLTADILSGIPGQGDHVVMDYRSGVTPAGTEPETADEVQVLE